MQVGLLSSNSQIKCSVCEKGFQKENRRAVQLVCSHILHDNCFSSSVQNCPSCSSRIVDRTIKNYTAQYKEELAKDFNNFLEEFSRYLPINLYADVDFTRTQVIEKLIMAKDANEILMFFRRILRLFSTVGLNGSFQKIFIEWIKKEVENEPLKGIPDMLQDLYEFAGKAKDHLFSTHLFGVDKSSNAYLRHFEDIFNEAFQDPTLQNMLFNKRQSYRAAFRCKDTFEQWIAMVKMTEAQFSLIAHFPEASCYKIVTQNADKIVITCAILLVFIQINLSYLQG